jgi:hypothetical protein
MIAAAASAHAGSGGIGTSGTSGGATGCSDQRYGSRSLRLGDCGDDLLAQQCFHIAGFLEPLTGAGNRGLGRFAPRFEIDEQIPPFARFQADVLTGISFEQEITPPSGKGIGPGFDSVGVPRGLRGHEACVPTIIIVMMHRLPAPLGLALPPPKQVGCDHLMAVAEYIGPDIDGFTSNPLDRVSAAIDARINILNDKPAAQQVAD